MEKINGLKIGLLAVNRIMKLKFSMLFILLILFGCTPEPEFYINGIPYYTRSRCIESTHETVWEYHYGFSFMGKYEYHYGPHTVTKCIQSTIDTIEIR